MNHPYYDSDEHPPHSDEEHYWEDDSPYMIHDMACGGHLRALRDALETGLEGWRVDELNHHNETPLHCSVKGGDMVDWGGRTGPQLKSVEILLDHGANIDAASGSGWTAMHFALDGRHIISKAESKIYWDAKIKCVELLIARGASLTSTTQSGHMPAEVIFRKHRRILPILFNAGAPLPRVEHAAWMRFSDKSMEGVTEMIAARRWVERIAAAGGWAAYKKARPASLARIFEPKFPLLPAEIIPIIVEFSFRKY